MRAGLNSNLVPTTITTRLSLPFLHNKLAIVLFHNLSISMLHRFQKRKTMTLQNNLKLDILHSESADLRQVRHL